MEQDRPRWRIRISTLMLLVVIAALLVALVIERSKRAHLEQQLASANARLPRYTTYPASTKARNVGDRAKVKVSRAVAKAGSVAEINAVLAEARRRLERRLRR